MSKVESVNSSSSFYGNNSSFPELKFGLDIPEDCSAKSDFDIFSLLCDNESYQEKQYIFNDDRNDSKNSHKNGRSSPLTALKTESLKLTPLGSLAENHLKKSKMLPELSFDGNFSLSDLLYNDDCPNNAKQISACENDVFNFLVTDDGNRNVGKTLGAESDNLLDFLLTEDGNLNVGKTSGAENDSLFDFLLTEDHNPDVRKISTAKNDISFDDLSQWMNSSITHNSESSKSFPTDHFSCAVFKDKLESTSFFLHQTETIDTDKSKLENKVSNVDLENFLRDMSIDVSEKTDSADTTDSSETKGEESESTDETSGNDFIPDIDLTFCIKKKSKNDSSFYGNSPETIDSGFDELDFVADKLSSSSAGKFFYKDILISPTIAGNKNVTIGKFKKSLFSKAISAKPKVDDSRRLRLKNVVKELIKGSTPSLYYDDSMKIKESQRTIDHRNEHVIASNFLIFEEDK